MEVSWNGPRVGQHERLSCLWCRGGARQLGVSPGVAARSPAGLSPAPARTSAGSARGRARRAARAEDPSADAAYVQEGHGRYGPPMTRYFEVWVSLTWRRTGVKNGR